jgi:hypothetical protein
LYIISKNVWNRLILVREGNENVFLVDNMLLHAAAVLRDYHGEMNGTSFEKLVKHLTCHVSL